MEVSNPLVSIIMPAYNGEPYIAQTLDSVLAQSYPHWEVEVVDDCSSDGTAEVIQAYARRDSRIHYHKLETNSGAAIARKTAIQFARGRYLAFLDADDLWLPQKLEKQLGYMQASGDAFTGTVYGKITEAGEILPVVRDDSWIHTYRDFLKGSPGNLTIIYDTQQLGKIYPIDIRRRNDYVLWLQVIKKSKTFTCYPDLLAYHRVRSNSISSNKLRLIKYQWQVYYNIEKLGLLRSAYYTGYCSLRGVVQQIQKIASRR